MKLEGWIAMIGLVAAVVQPGGAQEPVQPGRMTGRQRLAVGMGHGATSANVARIGWQLDFKSRWMESETGFLSGLHELSLNYWHGDDDEVWGLFYAPAFVYRFAGPASRINPYLEAGIGAGLISKTRIDGRQLSTAFQFEDRIGVGLRFGDRKQHDLNLRYLHYSNANIKKPNRGMDAVVLSYGVSF